MGGPIMETDFRAQLLTRPTVNFRKWDAGGARFLLFPPPEIMIQSWPEIIAGIRPRSAPEMESLAV